MTDLDALRRAIETVIAARFPVDPRRFELKVHRVDIDREDDAELSVTVHIHVKFLHGGSPFCCGEPMCHLSLFTWKGQRQLSRRLTELWRCSRVLEIKLKEQTEYEQGVRFNIK